MVIAGFLLDIFFRKLLAKPIDIGEIRQRIEPSEKLIFSISPKEMITQAANIKKIPIQRNLEMSSLNNRNAIRDVEIISKDANKDALELDKYLRPNIKDIADPV